MAIAQVRNDEMVGLLGADLLPATDRNLAAEFYVSNEAFTFAAPHVVPLAATWLNLAPTLFTLDAVNYNVTITQAGIYRFDYDIGFDRSSGAEEATAIWWLEQDPATGTFTQVSYSWTVGNLRTVGAASCHGSKLMRVGTNYRYRLGGIRDVGTLNLKYWNAGSTRLGITCLYLTP